MAVRRLGEAIAVGLIDVGEQLPTEMELAEQLGIATVSLREALAVLSEGGYVETRRGRGGGMFVCRPILPAPLDAVVRRGSAARSQRGRPARPVRVPARDLGRSGRARSRAAHGRRGTRARGARGRHGGACRDRAFRRADSRFHIAIAGAARSPRLVTFETSPAGRVARPARACAEPRPARATAIAEHREIAHWRSATRTRTWPAPSASGTSGASRSTWNPAARRRSASRARSRLPTERIEHMASEGHIDVPGGSVWYRSVGEGPGAPLLVVHGGPGFCHDYLTALDDLADRRAGRSTGTSSAAGARSAPRTSRSGPSSATSQEVDAVRTHSASSATTCSATRGAGCSACSTRSTGGRRCSA